MDVAVNTLLQPTNPRVAFLVAGSGGLLATLIAAGSIRRSTPKR